MSGNAPSPWSWSDEYRTIDGRPTWSLVAADGYGILSCDGEENSPQGINEPALASLIASAPMLLEALKPFADLRKHFTSKHGSRPTSGTIAAWHMGGGFDELTVEHLIAAVEAISAATGETK